MFDVIYFIKDWWLNETKARNEMEKFERLESKHTRVHHDADMFEQIRIH